MIDVARQLGHGAALTLGTHGHVIDELDGCPRQDAESVIWPLARAVLPITAE